VGGGGSGAASSGAGGGGVGGGSDAGPSVGGAASSGGASCGAAGSSATGRVAPQFGQKRAPSGACWLHDGQITVVPLKVGRVRSSVCPARGPRCGNRQPRMEATISATSVGFLPTFTPTFSNASALACAVPLEPVMIAPAWPIRFPGGAVNPAT